MIKKRYITLGIFGILFYGLFFYEPNLDESDVQTFLSIQTNSDNQHVNISLADAASLDVDSKSGTNINVNDEIRLSASNEGTKANVLGVGNTIEDVKENTSQTNNGAEVSISSGNPMLLSAGNIMYTNDAVHVDGTGISKVYQLDGQDLFVNGVKNQIKVDGHCKHVDINGVAMVVRIENAISVTVNGVGNRVYLSNDLPKDKKHKYGVLNFIFKK